MKNTEHLLKKYWGHTSFRAPQDKIIDAVLQHKNVIALLPTGGGKSVCFQIPPLMHEGICIVISPLIALMKDQVDSLNEKGIKAVIVNSGTKQDELITLFDNVRYGNYKFLYLSPERLQSSFIQEKIKQLNVNLIAIDEAHCISEWGHDFRPSYRKINILKSIKPTVPIIALTATATKKVLEDISTNLEINDALVFKKSFYRDNLAYQLFDTENKLERLIQICTKTKAPIIIYASSRNRTKEIADFLNTNKFKASYYHGGLTPNQKQASFDNWISETTPIIVATNAFGMGIDKSNVRVVVHADLPNSIESYIQEAGRAGRDGKKAFSAVLYNANDIRISLEKIRNAFPSIQEIKNIYTSLFQNYQIANGELLEDAFDFNLLEFCNDYNYNSVKVEATLKLLHNNGIIDISNTYNKKSTVQFLASNNQVLKYTKTNTSSSTLIKLLLRSYGGIFEQETKINEFWLSKRNGILSSKVVTILEQLHSEKIIDYKKATKNSDLYFLVPREDDRTINSVSKDITKYIQQKIKKSEDLIHFVKNNAICRSVQILHYFNESSVIDCKICDVCLSKKNSYTNLSVNIMEYLKKQQQANSHQICNHISATEETILVNLQELLSEELIAINDYNQYYIL
jgi:ATP-dependent DNA helicase RecQ